MAETLFQGLWREYDEWHAAGALGKAPSRLAFDHRDVRAWVDPFRKLRGTVVVVPREGTPGVDAFVHDLPDHRQDQMTRVRNALTRKMLTVTGLRPIEHVEGYGVPDHAHFVLCPAARGAGSALYERVELPEEAELNETLAQFGVYGTEAAHLGRRLDALEDMTILLDESQLPWETVQAVRRIGERALLCT